MGASDGNAGFFGDDARHLQFMRGIAGGELTCNCKAADVGCLGLQKTAKSGGIQWRRLPACVVVAACKNQRRIALERVAQTVPIQICLGKADIDQRHASALTFNQRIGCQCRRQRRQRDLGWRHSSLRQHRLNRFADTNRQILPGCQGFRRGKHMRLITDQHRIGIGSAGIDPQKQCHSSSSCSHHPA